MLASCNCSNYWLIQHEYQRAQVIMHCPSCVVVIVVVIVCGQFPGHRLYDRNFLYAHLNIQSINLYFSNGSHFSCICLSCLFGHAQTLHIYNRSTFVLDLSTRKESDHQYPYSLIYGHLSICLWNFLIHTYLLKLYMSLLSLL